MINFVRNAFFSFLFFISLLYSKADKPNFIVIFTDDQGYGDLSCFGSKIIKTPNIDRIAKKEESLPTLWLHHQFVLLLEQPYQLGVIRNVSECINMFFFRHQKV